MLTEFAGNLAHPLEFGHALEIVAKTIDGASRFQISLSTAKSTVNPNADIGLNFACFFRKDCIQRNSRIAGQWGEQELEPSDPTSPNNPIVSGEFFVVYILVAEEKFHISINHQPFCTYSFRMPVHLLRSIEIRDNIQVIKQVDHRTIYPHPWPAIHASDYFKAFSNDIPILFSPGHVVVITARCFDNRKGQFIIKFHDSDSKREELHISVRFDQKAVVCNSMNKNFEFGAEKRPGGFPFSFNQQFKFAIAFAEREILTAVDGTNFFSYTYRSHNILQSLTGFKLTCINGLHMHVTSVDHHNSGDPGCTGFEKFSRLDYECI